MIGSKFRVLLAAGAVAGLSMVGVSASAATIVLDSTTQCSAGNATNGIAVGDVTGSSGGATDCWGTFDGNDSQITQGDPIQIGSMLYYEIAKQDMPSSLSGTDIGLSVTPTSESTSGNWEFDPVKWATEGLGDFLIVLKAANSPGFATWLFEGDDADSYEGTWDVAWGKDLSHLTIYAKDATPCDPSQEDCGPPVNEIPLPAGLPLLLSALGAGVLVSRKKRKAA